MTHDIRIEQFYPHSPARVWRALTDPAALADWLMPNDFAPQVGHRFQFRAKPMPGWRGFVDCEVIQVDEPRVLAFTWRGDEDWIQPTTVRFTLSTAEGGTRLLFEHTGFLEPWGPPVSQMLSQGWKKMFEVRLSEVLTRLDSGESA